MVSVSRFWFSGTGLRVQGAGSRCGTPIVVKLALNRAQVSPPSTYLGLSSPPKQPSVRTGPPRARTYVICVDLGHWAISGSIQHTFATLHAALSSDLIDLSQIWNGIGAISYF